MNKRRFGKIIMLMASAIVIVFVLSSCYMEPDRTIDNENNVGNDGQNFEALVTPTPTMTATPYVTETPEMTSTIEPTESEEPTESSGLNLGVFDTPSLDENVTPKVDAKTTSIPVPTKKTVPTKKPTQKPNKTPKATAKPSKKPGSLKSGISGSRVKELQQRLKRLGYYRGSVDGKFGKGTEDAVSEFQKANKLKADGVVGNATLKKLYSNNARRANDSSNARPRNNEKHTNNKNSNVNKNKNTNSRVTEKPRLSHMPSVPKNKYISTTSSSTGADVRNLQNRLIDLGYLAGTADGVYGSATEKAIKAFQRSNSPYVDGIAGPDTLEILYSNKAKKSSRPVAVVAKPGESLQLGDEGPAVRTLQRRLKELNYLNSSVDGSYGEATKQAIMKFQNDNGINPDGIAGSSTLNLLYTEFPVGSEINTGDLVANISDASPDSERATSTGYSSLLINDEGKSVSNLQNKLSELGYYKGKDTGILDEDTREAIMSFQQKNYLTVDGVAGPTTQRLMYGDVLTNRPYTAVVPGSQGENVYNIQYTLYELGYLQHSLSSNYDEYTLGAISEFQGNNGLTISGTADEKTLSLLFSSFAKPASLNVASYNTLDLGSDGEAVISLQERLGELDYFNKNVNAVYDNNTQRAVITFQTYNGLTANGVADEITQSKLYSDVAIKKP